MRCAWNALMSILPPRIRRDAESLPHNELQEIRLRIDKIPMYIIKGRTSSLGQPVTLEDMRFVINTASKYSPWAASTASQGYITAPGGHRIGICGECVVQNGVITGFREISFLCIRVAKDYPGISNGISLRDSVLILGPPGCGKTTLLRDLIRRHGNDNINGICVIDERLELFPPGGCFDTGMATDILTGCGKPQGIEMALRTMGPQWIAVDEITSARDCDALIQAGWCGVKLLATAHATDLNDLRLRPIYRQLYDCGIWKEAIVLRQDKSWIRERMGA